MTISDLISKPNDPFIPGFQLRASRLNQNYVHRLIEKFSGGIYLGGEKKGVNVIV